MTDLKNLSRALRRHHRERLKKTRQDYWGHRPMAYQPERNWHPRSLGILTRTPHPCSCPMCGNPRRCFGERSIQERRWMQAVD